MIYRIMLPEHVVMVTEIMCYIVLPIAPCRAPMVSTRYFLPQNLAYTIESKGF